MSFKVLVPVDQWVPLPVATKFVPGHDAQIEVQEGSQNSTSVDIHFEFSDPTDCDSVTQLMSFNVPSSGCGSTPMVAQASVRLLTMDPKDVPSTIAK